MRRSISPGLSILFLATCAWAQRGGAIGAAGAVGSFRGGAGFARSQTFRPSPIVGNNSNRFPVSSLIGERFRERRPVVFSPFFLNGYGLNSFYPSYFNSSDPCAGPYFLYPSYCPQLSPYGPISYGVGPGAGYSGDPQDMAGGEYQGGNYQDPDGGQQETTWTAPDPPRASPFRRVDPRDVRWILDGHAQSSPMAGGPITIGSGNHTLGVAAPDSDRMPSPSSTKNPTE